MIRLADFEKNCCGWLHPYMLDKPAEQSQSHAPAAGGFSDNDVLQLPLRVNSMGYQEGQNSWRWVENPVGLRFAVIFCKQCEAFGLLLTS